MSVHGLPAKWRAEADDCDAKAREREAENPRSGQWFRGCANGHRLDAAELEDALRQSGEEAAEGECSRHPCAPHGFNRDASHSEDRYVCDCEGWRPDSQCAASRLIAQSHRLVEALRHAGTLLSNIAYNMAQDGNLSDSTRFSLDDARKRWDAALAAHDAGASK